MSYARKLDDVALLLDELEGLEPPASNGKALEIPLASIEEDPDQPRRAFDAKTLEELAASIRERGVLQPIGVTPASPTGMHRIVFGARRFRAAKLAGSATIAAFIHSGETPDPYDQMIENIQRDDLSAADIAAFIAFRLAAGEKQKDIALRLGKDKSYIAMYASVAQMAPVLQERLTSSPIRAVYELHQMWKKFPQAVEAFCAENNSFTRVRVMAFCEGLGDRPSQMDDASLRDALHDAGNPHGGETLPGADRKLDCVPQGGGSCEPGSLHPSGWTHDEEAQQLVRPTRRKPQVGLATLRIEHGQRSGQLMLDRGSSKGEAHGLVFFEDDGAVEDLPLAALKLVALKTGLPSA